MFKHYNSFLKHIISLDNPCIFDARISMNYVKFAQTQIILYMVKQNQNHRYYRNLAEILFDQINMVAYGLTDVSRKSKVNIRAKKHFVINNQIKHNFFVCFDVN